ncbi:MAG TPA: hypothetical protein VEW28_00030 [Candidatus Kapabacteria bacterium]|nr:hypothetical protein [Candidatus Kapabacteria bacterium]
MTIEDRIIAYFDGGLSSAERIELMREIRGSSEAEKIFNEHRLLRHLAERSSSSIHAPDYFADRLDAIVASAPQTNTVSTWSYSRRLVPIILLLLLGAGIGSALLNNGNAGRQATSLRRNVPSVAPKIALEQEQVSSSDLIHPTINYKAIKLTNLANSFVTASDKLQTINQAQDELPIIVRTPVNDILENVTMSRENVHSLAELRSGTDAMPANRFEAGLQTSSGFTYPADAQSIKPFAGQRLSVGYYLTSSDVVGVRLTSGLYQVPGSPVISIESGVTFIQQSLETRRAWGGELYGSHHIAGILGTPLTAVVTVSGGMIPNGYTLAAEAGVRIPTGNNFAFSVDFALARIHSNISRPSAILANADASSAPVTYSGPDVRTTFNGSLHYGIQYIF